MNVFFIKMKKKTKKISQKFEINNLKKKFLQTSG